MYIVVGSIVYWRLIPRLSSTAKWLATAMLAAQVLVIALSLELRLVSQLAWFFDLDKEFNIPTILAATQLALASGIALAASVLGRALPFSRHLLHVALAFVLLFITWVEYFLSHKRTYMPFGEWDYVYLAIGSVFALTVINVAWRSPKPVRIWCLSLMAGLAIAAAGALLVDLIVSAPCKRLGLYSESKCVLRTIEESLELLGVWVVIVAALGLFSDVAPTPSRRTGFAMLLLPLAIFACFALHSLFIHGTLGWLKIGIKRQQLE